tara:strand:+ start:175 stop:498 length:324 start_codon:yes stop_codon:yes gene_type:complete
MTLQVDLTKCKETKIKKSVDAFTLGMLAWNIGMSCITEENYQEFYLRLRLYLFTSKQKQFLTLNQVRQLIGVSTNVAYISQSKFLNHHFKYSLIELERENISFKKVA